MKHLYYRLIIAFSLLILLSACQTDDPQPTPTPTPAVTPIDGEDSAEADQNILATDTPDAPFPGDGPWDVQIEIEGGIVLHGTLYGKGSVGVLLAPMYPGEQAGWQFFAETLAESGYRVLTFDFRGHGQSTGAPNTIESSTDLAAALDFLRQQEVEQTVILGAEVGGLAAIQVAGANPDIAGIAIISSPMGVDGLEIAESEVAALQMPSLWVASRIDMAQQVETLYDLAGGDQKELWIYEGSSLHGTYIFEGADSVDLTRRLIEFVQSVTSS